MEANGGRNRPKSYFFRGGLDPLLGQTIPEHLESVVRRFEKTEALVSVPQRRRLTYAGLWKAVDGVTRGLLALGLRKGDRVGIWSTNNIEWVLVQLATARIGAVLVTINPGYRPRELEFALGKSGIKALFMAPGFRRNDYVASLLAIAPEVRTSAQPVLRARALPLLRYAVLFDPADPGGTARPAPGFLTWQEVIGAGQEIASRSVENACASLDRDDPINIQYTSGTTGSPKAVLLSHHNILNNAWFTARELGFTSKDRLCVPVPFYHCFGMVLSSLMSLASGACMVIPCEHFDAAAVLSAVAGERCTVIHGVPTMFLAELNHPDLARFDLGSLRTGIMAGAPCPPTLIEAVMSRLHCPDIRIGYGETEASPLTHLTGSAAAKAQRLHSVGTNLPHQEAKIVDLSTGQTVPLGEEGEVCFRGYHVMRGYYDDPEATAEAIDRRGWLHSGDIGVMEADGYLRVTGRLKEMIIRGGENIYPREIEEVLYEHPAVAEVAVFGVADPEYGERVVAWVRPAAGAEASAEALEAHCRERMAHFKVPSRFRFVEQFPMTVTGKLQRFRMREMEEQAAQEGKGG